MIGWRPLRRSVDLTVTLSERLGSYKQAMALPPAPGSRWVSKHAFFTLALGTRVLSLPRPIVGTLWACSFLGAVAGVILALVNGSLRWDSIHGGS